MKESKSQRRRWKRRRPASGSFPLNHSLIVGALIAHVGPRVATSARPLASMPPGERLLIQAFVEELPRHVDANRCLCFIIAMLVRVLSQI